MDSAKSVLLRLQCHARYTPQLLHGAKLSLLGMRLESTKRENKDTAETLFWHVTLIPSRADREEVGCEVELLGNISRISGSREINVIPPCYYLRLGPCALEIMSDRRSGIKGLLSPNNACIWLAFGCCWWTEVALSPASVQWWQRHEKNKAEEWRSDKERVRSFMNFYFFTLVFFTLFFKNMHAFNKMKSMQLSGAY